LARLSLASFSFQKIADALSDFAGVRFQREWRNNVVNGLWAHGVVCPSSPAVRPFRKEKRFDQCHEPQQWANLLGK
jgi:hypothetical protein